MGEGACLCVCGGGGACLCECMYLFTWRGVVTARRRNAVRDTMCRLSFTALQHFLIIYIIYIIYVTGPMKTLNTAIVKLL